MGTTVGAPIRPKHNVPRPYHGPGDISSREAYKRQRKRQENKGGGIFSDEKQNEKERK
jgi:hypothetical protein